VRSSTSADRSDTTLISRLTFRATGASYDHVSPPSHPHPHESPGSPELFEDVLERHGPALLRFCVARLGREGGEDAFQETMLAALRHYDELRDRNAVGGWLFSIAQRKIVDAARRSARTRTAEGGVDVDSLVWHDPEDRSGIWSQVALLPPKQREAVGLRFIADLSHGDIGVVMGTTAEAARRNVYEGLKRLRTEVAHA
jgi:RNA polymerase sigma factor (sigma-70 family)